MLSIFRVSGREDNIQLMNDIPNEYQKKYDYLITIFNQDEMIFEQFLLNEITLKKNLNNFFKEEWKNYYLSDDLEYYKLYIFRGVEHRTKSNKKLKAYIYSFTEPKNINILYECKEYCICE